MYRLSRFLLTGILFLSVHSTSLARDKALHTTEIANLSEIWAAGRYLNPDLATAPKEWDSLYSELAAKLAKGQISLADAQDKLAKLSGFYQIKPRYFSKIDVVKTIQSGAQNGITNLPGYLILRLRNKLTDAEVETIKKALDSSNLILDLRMDEGTEPFTQGLWNYTFLNSDHLEMLGLTWNLPSLESLVYEGYPTEAYYSTGDFKSYLMQSSSDELRGIRSTASGKNKPIFILGNKNTVVPGPVLAARFAGKAKFVSVDKAFIYNSLPEIRFEFAGINSYMRLARFKELDLNRALQPDRIITESCASDDACLVKVFSERNGTVLNSFAQSKSAELFPSEHLSWESPDDYPQLPHRLYAISKLFHVLNRFHPDSELLGRDIHARYLKAIKDVILAADANQYISALAEFIAPIKDGHVEIKAQSYYKLFGNGDIPVSLFYEQGIYVACVSDVATGLKLGDKLLKVDGVPVAERLNQLGRMSTASPSQDKSAASAKYIFRGALNSQLQLEVEGVDGETRSLNLTRKKLNERRCVPPWSPKRHPDFNWLDKNTVYLNLTKIGFDRISDYIPELQNAKNIIVDLRGAAMAAGWTLAAHLNSKNYVDVALAKRPLILARDFKTGESRHAATFSNYTQVVKGGETPVIMAKLYILVDENTQSQAEYTVQMLKSSSSFGVTIIGGETAGNLGDATTMVLPGAVRVQFSGTSYVDFSGNKLLGKGIQPEIRVTPALPDLLNNRDVALDAAKKLVFMPAELDKP